MVFNLASFRIDPNRLPASAVEGARQGRPIPIWPGYFAFAKTLEKEAAEFRKKYRPNNIPDPELLSARGAIELAIPHRLPEGPVRERYFAAIEDYYDEMRSRT